MVCDNTRASISQSGGAVNSAREGALIERRVLPGTHPSVYTREVWKETGTTWIVLLDEPREGSRSDGGLWSSKIPSFSEVYEALRQPFDHHRIDEIECEDYGITTKFISRLILPKHPSRNILKMLVERMGVQVCGLQEYLRIWIVQETFEEACGKNRRNASIWLAFFGSQLKITWKCEPFNVPCLWDWSDEACLGFSPSNFQARK